MKKLLVDLMKSNRRLRYHRMVFGSQGYLTYCRELARSGKLIEARLPGYSHAFHLRLTSSGKPSSDIPTFVQVFCLEEYRIDLAIAPKVIVDAGANIGCTSVYFARQYPDAKIISIEPERENFELLKKNTEKYPNVIPLQAALWKENAPIKLYDRNSGSWGFAVSGNAASAAEKGLEIPGITIPELMERYKLEHIDFLKIDIEGSEKEVFQSSRDWIPHVGVIAAELHDSIKMGCERAFFMATGDFDFEFRREGTVFVMRSRYVQAVDRTTFAPIARPEILQPI